MNQVSTLSRKGTADEHAVAAPHRRGGDGEEKKITLPLLGGAITTRTITLFFDESDHEARTYSMSGVGEFNKPI